MFHSNHSLHRSDMTCLFQAGVDRKIVKEYTGHVSDAVNKYQITSADQREKLSEIIQGKDRDRKSETAPKCENSVQEIACGSDVCNKKKVEKTPIKESNTELEVTLKNVNDYGTPQFACTCHKNSLSMKESDQIGKIVEGLMSARKTGKAKVKIEIEFSD